MNISDLSSALAAKGEKLTNLKNVQHTFDIKRIEKFYRAVFHAGVLEDAIPLLYAPDNNQPRKAIYSLDRFRKKIERTKHAHALYFCISSVFADTGGRYSHKKLQFASLHVVVLDDIGTKVDWNSLPALFQKPSYIIETSKDNFQYGFILENPVDEHAHATALVETMALAGLTDSGGVSATKLVRLPDGLNGKNDPSLDKGLFHVRLVEMAGTHFTPGQLVNAAALEIGGALVTWAAIENGYSPSKTKAKTRYMSVQPEYMTADGVVDRVLEWLGKNDMVVSDTGGDWIDILCPWSAEHSTGEDVAGYAPLGRGEDRSRRGFHCFHEGCKTRNTEEFLRHVLVNSNFQSLGIEDLAAELLGENVFDEQQNAVWRVREGQPPSLKPLDGFKNANNHKSYVLVGAKGVGKYMAAFQQWMESPYRLVVAGSTYVAGEPRILNRNGEKLLNTYQPPPWGTGNFDLNTVSKFTDFLTYLIPESSERNYFIQWLAAKVQDPKHRGTGIVMCTPAYGTGRSTLANMLAQILGTHNTANISFEDLTKLECFNHWENKSMVFVNEAMENRSANDTQGRRKAYEAMKQRVDTTVVNTTFNEKYMRQREITVTSSYLILTNHEDAIAIPEDDRRFTVIQNPVVAESPDYFVDLRKWIDDPKWAGDVYRWLQKTPVDFKALKLPLVTSAKSVMALSSMQPPERIAGIIALFAKENGQHYALMSQIKSSIEKALNICTAEDVGRYRNERINKAAGDVVHRFHNYKMRACNGSTPSRIAVFANALKSGAVDASVSGNLHEKGKDLPRGLMDDMRKDVDKWDMDMIVKYVVDNF